MKELFSKILFKIFIFIGILISLLPFKILYLISDLFYFITFYIIGYRKKVVSHNLKKAFPAKTEKERYLIAKKFYHHFCDLFIEIIKQLTISPEEFKRHFEFENQEFLDTYYRNGNQVLVVMGHYNNWEYMAAMPFYTKFGFSVIYKPLTNKRFDELMIKIRTRFGAKVVPMSQTARFLTQNLAEKKPHMLVFISDQSPQSHEIQHWSDFLNQKTAVYLGIEKLAAKTKQPVTYLHISKIKRGKYKASVIPICDDASKLNQFELTDLHTKILEQKIIETPEYWLWSHRRWKLTPNNL